MKDSPYINFERPNGIGGSDIAAILGLSPYKTPLEVWVRLVGGSEAEKGDKLHLRFGHHAESFVALEYERATELKTQVHPEPFFHSDFGYMFGHVDRLVCDSDQSCAFDGERILSNRLLECKTASAFNRFEWGESGSDQVPAGYLMQCAWYLAITRCQYADIAALIGNNDFRIYHLERDLELEDLLLAHAKQFWHDHVLGMTPPKPINPKDALLLFPMHNEGIEVEANADIQKICQQYQEKLDQADAASSECERLKTEIMNFMGQAEKLTHQGKTLATWKNAKPSVRLDTKALSKAYPEIASQFSSASAGSRRFLFKDAR